MCDLVNKCSILIGCVWKRKASHFLLDFCVLGIVGSVLKKCFMQLTTESKAEK